MASLEQLKKEVIEILKRKEKQENKDIKKAIESFEKEERNYSYLEKSSSGEWIEKAGYAVGQMRIWRGKKYKKVSTSPSRWVRVYDSHSRGAAISIGKYIAQVNKCKSVEELYQFCMKEKALFKDANGVDLPILDKLKKEIDKKNESLSGKKNSSIKEKKGALKVLSKEETKEFIKKHKNSKVNERVSLGTISEDAKKRIKQATGLDVERVILDSDSIRHAFDPKHNLEENDLDDMKDVVETSTDISLSPNKNKTGNPIIIFKKQEPNGVILLEEYRAGKKELELQTAYRVRKNRQPLSVDKQPLANVQNVAAPSSTITDNDENVKQGNRETLKTEISDYYKEQLSYSKWIAERSVKKLGEKKLKEIADKNMKSDEDWKNELSEKVSEMIKENPQDEEKIKDSMKTAIYFHAVRVLEVDLARKKLDSMSKNIEMKDVPVKDSDMTEARSIIGGDVARILDGRDVYGNAKQTLQDKIKRRFKTNPAVCRAMLVYIKQEQEKTGKQVFTARNGIWELLPKLNEKAQEAAEKGESETPTGTSGNLYENDNGVSIVENKDWGRYQISFPGKPDGSTISMLKRNGFRWSPSTKTWVCYNGENGERKIKYVAEQLGLNEVKKSFDFGKYLKKSMDFNELKKWALNHLKKQLKKEDVQKSLYFTTFEVIQKAAYPVGTIREWKGKKYIKIAPGKWMRKYDNAQGIGYNRAIKNLMRKIESAETPEQLYSLVKQNLRRFRDENGKILPEVREIYKMTKEGKTGENKGNQGKVSPKTETKKEQSRDFKLSDIADLKTKGDIKKIKTVEDAKDVIKQIAETHGTSAEGKKLLGNFMMLNVGGSNPIYDKVYESFGISYNDIDANYEAVKSKMLKMSLGQKNNTKEDKQIKQGKEDFGNRYREGIENEDKNYKVAKENETREKERKQEISIKKSYGIYISKEKYQEFVEKGYGKKDLSKLTKKQITDKNGHTRNVWVRMGEEPKKKRTKKQEENTNKKATKGIDYETAKRAIDEGKEVEWYSVYSKKWNTVEPGTSELIMARDIGAELRIKPSTKSSTSDSSKYSEGTTISFEYGGNTLEGDIIAVGKDGVTVSNDKGGTYKVRYENINKVTKTPNVSKLLDKSFVQTGWRNGTDGYQPKSFDTIEGLYKGVEAVQKEFSDLSESVKEHFKELNPLLLKRKTLKGVDRVKEKLREDARDSLKKAREAGDLNFKPEEYDEKTDTYHCRTIRDCDGHTFCMNNLEDVSKIMQFYNNQDYVVRMKNNFAKPSPVGYSDINMNIRLSNGAIVEMQLNTTANMVAKERYGHSLYEVYRSINSNPEYKELADLMGNAQNALYGLANQYSKDGNYPEVPGGDIFDKNYKHEPYAKAIESYVKKSLPLFERAKKDGVLNSKTIEHFENLVDYIK